jgi:hypothetical protein
VHKNAGALTWDPQVDLVCWDLGKQKSSCARPNWSFRPFVEANAYALQLGVRSDQLIESGIDLLNILS